jgi:hypothetical protein
MLNLELGVYDIVGGLANTRVGSYLYPREIKKVTEGFVVLLHQPDRKLGMAWRCAIWTWSALESFFLDMLTRVTIFYFILLSHK